MLILQLLPLLTGLTSLLLAVIVLSGQKKVALRWPFACFAFAMGLWSICISLFLITTDPSWALVFALVYYASALLLVYGFLLFSLVFAEKGTLDKYKKRWAVVLAVPILLVLTDVIRPNGLIEGVTVGSMGGNVVSLAADTYFIYSIVFILYGLAALVLLVTKSLQARKTKRMSRETKQLHLITVVMSICLPAGALFNLMLPLVGNYYFIMIGPLFALPIVVVIFYAIMKYSLFDIRLALVRSAAYLLSLVTLGVIYFILAVFVSQLFFGEAFVAEYSIINFGLAIIVAFTFQPLRSFFDMVTNRIFYQGVYNSDEFFARLTRKLTSTTDLRGLLERAAYEIGDTLKAEQAFFFVYCSDNRHISTGTRHHKRLPVHDIQMLDEYISRHGDGLLVAEAFTSDHAMSRLMRSHKIALLLPLIGAENTIGYMCLGERRSGEYSRRDIKVLATVTDELIIAIQNALSVQEVKELNATLQQRIDEATKELRHSNAQLQRLDEAKDEFVSMASHQLRTPLTSVKGYIDMVLEGDAGKISDMQKHLLGEAFTSSERMVHLINDFLNVSRLQTGKFMIDRRAIDLAKVVAQEVDSLRTTAKQRKLTLQYKEPSKFPTLYLDEGKVRQVVMNFIDNAMYYSKMETVIKIELSIDDSQVCLKVKDTGIGVPENEQANLFTKFYRASNARKQRPDGTGVGLYLAKRVIVAHGGKVVFESSLGKGSVFGFCLPLKQVESAPAHETDNLDN